MSTFCLVFPLYLRQNEKPLCVRHLGNSTSTSPERGDLKNAETSRIRLRHRLLLWRHESGSDRGLDFHLREWYFNPALSVWQTLLLFFCLFLLICGVCLCYGYNGYTEIFIFLLLASYKLSSLRFFNPYPRYYRYHYQPCYCRWNFH